MKKIFTPFIFTIVLIMAIGSIDGNAQVTNDASITVIHIPTCIPVLTATVANFGNTYIQSVKIGWSVDGVYQTPNNYNKTIKPDTMVVLVLSPNYNFVNGKTYTVKVFTYAPNNTTDDEIVNDTAKITFKYSVRNPYGAAFIKGTPFVSPNPNTTGTKADPDIVVYNNKLTYELAPPTGFTNSNYGFTWFSEPPVVKSFKGINISKSYWSYSAPSSSSPGKLTFNPDKVLQDTCLLITLQIINISGDWCDSTISRHICVVQSAGSDFFNITYNGIKVFPNPNNGHFKVSIENPKSDIKINIYNVLGELILSKESKVSQSEYSIDLDGLVGLCILKVNNGGFISTHLVSINK